MEIVLRAAAIFLFLWMITRVIGKKELAEMSAFELVLIVTIGDLVQQGVTQEDMSVTGSMLAVGTIALLVVAMSYIGFRWRGSDRIIEGVPVIVVDDGSILSEVIAVERLSEEEVVSSARAQGIEDLRQVRYGVLEPDGSFSFVRIDGAHPSPSPQTPS
jgi:uncharacterized membrane protein YcaP (DUF421 family)